MDNKKLSIGINIVLVLGLVSSIAGAVYFRSKYLELKNFTPKEVITEVVKEVKVESPDKDAEIADLKKQLADAKQQTPNAEKQPAPKPQPQQNDRRRGRSNFSLAKMHEAD